MEANKVNLKNKFEFNKSKSLAFRNSLTIGQKESTSNQFSNKGSQMYTIIKSLKCKKQTLQKGNNASIR